MKFFKLLLFLVVFLLFGIWHLAFGIPRSDAADAIPGEAPIPCEDTRNPEFNSDRPYQASPCGDANKALFCSNSIIMTIGSVSKTYSAADCPGYVCDVNIHKKIDKVIVDLTNVQVPVLGNTQQVKNSANSGSSIDDATRMNEYVSSYLSGTNDQAEYGPTDISKVVDFSGPLKKLLPTIIQDAQRIASIASASSDTTYIPEVENPSDNPQPATEHQTHNQIVVCGKKEFSLPSWITWLPDLFHLGSHGIGREIPTECYPGDKSETFGNVDVYRLTNVDTHDNNWAEKDTFQEALNWAGQYLPKLFPGNVTAQMLADAVNRWPLKIPPLPWSDQYGKPFKSNMEYEKAYNEWKGSLCTIISDHLFCLDAWPWINNPYADLFPYIPLANTTDKIAGQTINSIEIQSGGRAVIDQDSKTSTLVKKPKLYFSHTQEGADLSALLQKTFKSASASGEKVPNDVEDNSSCQIVKSYTNPGDDATFDNPKSFLEIHDIEYTVTSIKCSNPHDARECDLRDIDGTCLHYKTITTADCSDDIYLKIPMQNKSPNLDEIWKNTVAGDQSIFRRIYPKTGADAPVSCIADTPGVSPITYSSETNIGINQVIEPDDSRVGSLDKAEKSIDAQYYFPHLGGISDYFLKGIQTALRPKGYGEQTTNSQYCTNIQCGELPILPKAQGSCTLGSTSSRIGDIPKSLKDIVSAAAQTYKVPPNLILARMFGEGSFNTDITGKHYTRFNWTDQNVKNWATCTKMPGCSDTAPDNWIGFDGTFDNILKGSTVQADIKKIDPTRTKLSQCNLLDGIYAAAWDLHKSASGGMAFQCFGLDLKADIPDSCDWNNNQYESAIKVYESGFTRACLTLVGSCATGGSLDASCPNGDTCEHYNDPGTGTSHNACVWDVGHGK